MPDALQLPTDTNVHFSINKEDNTDLLMSEDQQMHASPQLSPNVQRAFDLVSLIQAERDCILVYLPFILHHLRAAYIPPHAPTTRPDFSSMHEVTIQRWQMGALCISALCSGSSASTFKGHPSSKDLLARALPDVV